MAAPYPPPQPAPPPYFAPQPPARSNRGLVIGLVAGVAALLVLCAAGVVGTVWFLRHQQSGDDEIRGVVDYRATHPEWLAQEHRPDDEQIEYPMTPPAGGPHHAVWQQCQGDVYSVAIDSGSAVHSLEHGAVWVTYQPGLPAAEIERLAARVRGQDYSMLSPFAGQPTKVSLQAWGYQLQVSTVDDARIDKFLRKYRQAATVEPGAPCTSGTTATVGG